MADPRPDVLVIGAGVSGLTTGICLAEAGLRVVIRADRPPGETTSAVAGALWGLHQVESGGRAPGWGRARLAELTPPSRQPRTRLRMGNRLPAARPPRP